MGSYGSNLLNPVTNQSLQQNSVDLTNVSINTSHKDGGGASSLVSEGYDRHALFRACLQGPTEVVLSFSELPFLEVHESSKQSHTGEME